MAAGAADVVERPLHELAGIARIAEIAGGDHHVPLHDARHHRPGDLFHLEEEVGDERDQVFARDLAQVRRIQRPADLGALHRPGQASQAFEIGFRPFHLADERRVRQGIQETERIEVRFVGVARQEQGVGLDRVEHRGGGPLRDVGVDGAKMLGENGAGGAVVGPDVLESRAVPGPRGVMVDDEVHAVDQPAEVVRLHVDGGDAGELGHRSAVEQLDLDVEQVGHPDVLGSGHPLERPDDGGRPGAVEQGAEGEAAGHRVGVRVVVQQNQDTVGVCEKPLVLFDPRAGDGPFQRRSQGAPEQLGESQSADPRRRQQPLPFLLPGAPGPLGVEQIHERGPRVPYRLDRPARAPAGGILDEDAGGGTDVGLEPGVDPARVADVDGDAGIFQAPSEEPVFDDELNVQARLERPGQESNEQFVLADGEAFHAADRSSRVPSAQALHYSRRGSRAAGRPERESDKMPTMEPRSGGFRGGSRRVRCADM